MDSSLNHLSNCEKLSLSTNMITNIQNINSMQKLKILSLGRNLLKSLAGKP
jgi:dynein light chain 1